ncbi:MAG: AAA family ATPase [Sporichthyaceae bacterium]
MYQESEPASSENAFAESGSSPPVRPIEFDLSGLWEESTACALDREETPDAEGAEWSPFDGPEIDLLGYMQARKILANDRAREIVAEHNARTRAPLPVYDLNALDALAPLEPLLGEVLQANTLALLSGKFGTYKSFLALAWSFHLASGRPWNGHAIAEPVPVGYLAAEGAYGIRRRRDAWVAEHGAIEAGMFTLIGRAANLGTDAGADELTRIVEERGLRFLVLDTLHRCTPGLDENQSAEMGAVIARLDRLRDRTGCTVMPVHHTGHQGQRARGSSSLDDDIDTSWVIELAGDGENRAAHISRTLKHRKTKDGELLEPMRLEFVPVEGTGSGWVRAADSDADRAAQLAHDIDPVQRVIEAAPGALTVGEVAGLVWGEGFTPSMRQSTQRTLDAASRDGRLVRLDTRPATFKANPR